MNSVLSYIGKKDLRYLDTSEIEVIRHSRLYCELFSGSFNLGIQLIDTGILDINNHLIVLNDLDYKVINFWRQLADNYENIVDNLDNKLLTIDDSELNKYELAAKELLLRETRFNIDNSLCELCIQSEYMKSIDIRNCDYKELLQELNRNDDFLFIDPPYIDVRNIKKYYRCDSDKFDHIELRDVLENTESKFVLTYNKNDKIIDMYKQYNIREITKTIYGKRYTELVIRNF